MEIEIGPDEWTRIRKKIFEFQKLFLTSGPLLILHIFAFRHADSMEFMETGLNLNRRTPQWLARAVFLKRLGAAPPLPAPLAEGRPGLAVRLLEAGARVNVPDIRGFGLSDKPQAWRHTAMPRWPAMRWP